MDSQKFSRKQFLATAATGSLAFVASPSFPALGNTSGRGGELAVLGGEPVRKGMSWPDWPYVDADVVKNVVDTTSSGIWSRIQSSTGKVATFEKEYPKLMGMEYAVATGSGTQALSTCVEALGIGPGDEVITSPYTDMGTIASILMSRALPVMADLDRESFQMDPDDIERKVNERTKAIMPVHIMGYPCDMDRIMDIAAQNDLKVIEDACQAHLAEYKGQKLGTIGDLGCFSFQASKQVACGEGGMIVGHDKELIDRCYAVHNRGADKQGSNSVIGTKYRMNEFEGAVLMGQLPGIVDRFEKREENARYLTSKIKDIPGIIPQKLYEGTGSGAHYKYAMRYDKRAFDNIDRSKFLKAVRAEGVGLSGYIRTGLHSEPWTDHILDLDVYKEMYPSARLRRYRDDLACPDCERVVEEMLVMNGPGPLLGSREDMDSVVDAIAKVYENRDKLDSI
ncbi:dTDP-4-amino-4,6-dideoxygalactose transaminase [Fodinibius roseus]|uniref:dTDP-4-amino-4,6-dideoxygalactose transaminase n=1 Tax=Fodinibius roseus TaxID=1194090 RepID=A0A1M4YMK6_9BACT|nr:DegT/DnrJ/EryC1/StrS family aminotransferase [Fodinibius roseus]SHF06867.1 dTDP-4-amino-4,6-dideoxygalactose transaminase [Fodinibius roseus]